MARLDPSSTLAGLRGASGSLVISSNDQGFYTRARFSPLTPRSYAQSEQRFIFSTLGILWRGLSSAERASFQTQAADPLWKRLDWFGAAYSIGPYGLFVALNYPLLFTSLDPVTTAPDPVFPAAVDISAASLTRSGAAASGSVTFTADLPDAAPLIQISLAPAVNASPAMRKWRRILDYVGYHNSTNTEALWRNAAGRLGLPLVGQTWTVFARVFDVSGRPSAWDSYPVTVGTP